MTVAQVACLACMDSCTCLAITCHAGSCLLDPACTVKCIDDGTILSFKTGVLTGGAKKLQEAVKSRVMKVLEAHGVFKDASTDRAGAFLQKADIETIAKHENASDEDFWNAIKHEANRVHFRLVYRNELQQYKKDERKSLRLSKARNPRTFQKRRNLKSLRQMSPLTSNTSRMERMQLTGWNHLDLAQTRVGLLS